MRAHYDHNVQSLAVNYMHTRERGKGQGKNIERLELIWLKTGSLFPSFSPTRYTLAPRRSARAMHSSWRSPTEKFSPFSWTGASRPWLKLWIWEKNKQRGEYSYSVWLVTTQCGLVYCEKRSRIGYAPYPWYARVLGHSRSANPNDFQKGRCYTWLSQQTAPKTDTRETDK